MTAHATIACDNCDAESGDYGWTSPPQARADLERAGWVRIGRRDYCPELACQYAAADHEMRLHGSSSRGGPLPAGMTIDRTKDGRWVVVPRG